MWWFIIPVLVILAGVVTVLLYGLLSARRPGAPSTALGVSHDATTLDRAIAPLVDQHPGQSGLVLVADNLRAFAIRAATARRAERSLDLQYYYWKDDLTGGLLAAELVKAADRGVRVRLLIDDINARAHDKNYLALDRHRNIEVRLFNPVRCRDNPFLRGIEMLLRFWSVSRRMHNKAWIADGRLAMVGGRNIGDAYFDAAETSNFRDMDLVAIGTAVDEAEAIFDRYWNSSVVFPIRTLGVSRKSDLGRLRQRLDAASKGAAAAPYLKRVFDEAIVEGMRSGAEPPHWTAAARVVSDPPEKASSAEADGWLLKIILPVIISAQKSVAIISPYFIPRISGQKQLVQLAERGVAVSVLTNSLAATDVAAVHGAYARYRKPLVAGGIKLFELRARRDGDRDMSLFGSKGASLHTKAFAVDGTFGFVGSFNFDPRSVSLNTEMGLLFEHPDLAAELLAVFARETAPQRSYPVVLAGGALRWRDGAGESARLLAREPEAGLGRRLAAWAIGLLPIESQL